MKTFIGKLLQVGRFDENKKKQLLTISSLCENKTLDFKAFE